MNLIITLLTKDNVEHDIPIEIYDSDLGNRWYTLVQRNKDLPGKYYHSAFINYTFKDISTIQSKLNDVTVKINAEYDRVLPLYDNVDRLNETVLNNLHEEYEIYGGRVDQFIKEEEFSQTLHDNFLTLNELIHTCEDVIHSVNLPVPPMSVISDCYPQTEFAHILERDKLYLKTDFRWGNIYLGYNTLGKDWLKVCMDNDLEVIERDMVKVQERFSAETWINFGPDDNLNYNARYFDQWYLDLPEELQTKVPINDLNKLSLGRYLIGTVIIDDRYFLKYHNNASDWISPNHPIKKKWNEEVFSTFKEIVKLGKDNRN